MLELTEISDISQSNAFIVQMETTWDPEKGNESLMIINKK